MSDESVPLSLERRVDEACDRFEGAWRDGKRPRIEDYLAEAPEPARGMLLRELLGLEIELRSGDREGPTPEEYQRRFPGHAELKVQGYKVEEIAERLGLARRTIHRKIDLVRKVWLAEARP